ncbi:hypothetical protein JXR93_11035 [bacterium]|nr:hypothetical protein [bacterium]
MRKAVILILLSLFISCAHNEEREESMLARYDDGKFADNPVSSTEESDKGSEKKDSKSVAKKDVKSNNTNSSEFEKFCFKNKKNEMSGAKLAKSKKNLVIRVFASSESLGGDAKMTQLEAESQARVKLASALGTINGFIGQKIGDELQEILDSKAKKEVKKSSKKTATEKVDIVEVITKAKVTGVEVTKTLNYKNRLYVCADINLENYYTKTLQEQIGAENISKIIEAIQDKLLIDAISEL